MRRLYSGVLLSALWAAPAAADTAMFSFPAPATGASTERGTDGFRFTPNVDLEVTALGYYDHNQDGFTNAFHPVAIYDFVTRAQLVKVSVQSTSPLDGLFRYAEIEPLTLVSGTSYVLAGYTSPQNNSHAENPAGLSIASEITFQGYRFAVGGSDVLFPTETFGDPFFGPNLLFRTETVAQPGDTNDDGIVDLVDLNNVRNNFGAAGQPILGDTAPYDGQVDLEDLNAVRNNFGAGGATSVPEPTGWVLGILLVAFSQTKRAARRFARPFVEC